MRIALEMGPGLGSAWARERRWHGPLGAMLVHLSIAVAWLSWPVAPPASLEPPVVELVLAPPPKAEPEPPAAAPLPEPARPAPPRPAEPKPVAAKPMPAPAPVAAKPAASAVAAEPGAPPDPAPAATAARTAEAPPPMAAPAAPPEPDLKPSPAEAPRPAYPRLARQRGWQGVVTVLVRVAEDGQPLEVAVKESSGHTLLDEAAVEAVRRWRFTPARQGGRHVAAAVEVPVRFALDGQGT